MASAGSPGSSCCSPKMITDTKNSVGMSCSRRLPRKPSIWIRVSGVGSRVSLGRLVVNKYHLATPDPRRPTAALLQLGARQPDQAVGHLLVSIELGGVGDDHQPVVEVDDRALRQHLLGHLLIDGLALGQRALGARLVQPPVDVRVAVA